MYLVILLIIAFIIYLFGSPLYNRIKSFFISRVNTGKLLMTILNKMSQNQSQASFKVNESSKSASIIYSRFGKEYIIMIPYAINYVPHMSQFKVELLRNGKEPLDITQESGIPYLVDAKSLGGESIRITNTETDKVRIYTTEIPMYGEEVMEFE